MPYKMIEFEYLHKSVFNRPIEPEVVEIYAKAHQNLMESDHQNKIKTAPVDIEKIVLKKLDLEAVEYFVRRSVGTNTLSQKLHILMYITESNSNYYDNFINEKSTFFRAVFSLCFFTIRSLYKYFKGSYLTRRYELV